MKLAPLIALAASPLLTVSMANASIHIGLGPVDEVDGKGSAMAAISWENEAKHPWEVMLGTIDARNSAVIPTPRVYFGSVSKRFTWNGFFAQGGIAATNVDNEVLSKHWQFMTGVGYRYEKFTISLRHLSNANTGGRNRGENFLLFQYGF